MKIEVTEKSLKDAGYALVEGDSITVPDDVGKEWCRLGWAKDVAGKVPTGERKVVGAELIPAKMTTSTKASTPKTGKEG